jgi:chromosome segregation ATPase
VLELSNQLTEIKRRHGELREQLDAMATKDQSDIASYLQQIEDLQTQKADLDAQCQQLTQDLESAKEEKEGVEEDLKKKESDLQVGKMVNDQ